MSCHNPTVSGADGFDGHAVWADLPQIISRESNKSVRFVLLVGDQAYADDWETQLLDEPNADARLRLYLSAYRRFWSNIHYRRVMCALPAVMMWDDHDITDGWGSRVDSYVGETSEFKPEWSRAEW
jgi:phosphodiesterase/alkaline phosphatase D-like protein